LAVGSIVVLAAHRIFAAVTDGTARLAAARQTLDREANARRWLLEAFGSLDVGSEGAGGFAGRADRVEFGAWLLGPRGWFERHRVALRVEDGALVARATDREPLVLEDSVTGAAFDYLLEPGASEAWVREWLSPVSAPLAVRVRIGRRAGTDTLLFIVGPRG
jgi:hypothetical protein